MKFWKKIMHFVLTICLIIPLMFTFTACGSSDGGGNSGGGGGTPSVTPVNPDPPAPSDPVLQSASNSFAGAKAIYARTGYTDVSGFATTMEKLLDTQIDVLAQDILYRLTYVYGSVDGSNNNRTEDNSSIILQTNGTDYKYNSAKAKTSADSIITAKITETFDSVTQIDLNNKVSALKEFQKSLSALDKMNILNNPLGIILTGAIDGHSVKMVSIMGNTSFSKNTENAWKMNSLKVEGGSTYANMKNEYLDTIKLGIAKILGASQSATEYSVELLKDIENLGYFDEQKEAISQYVLDSVIGTNLVTTDNGYYELWKNSYSGIINDANITTINKTKTLEEKAPRLYKGYSLVVPAIVEQALANTFEGTTTSLYPKMSRKAVTTTNVASGFSDAYTYQELIIKPKSGAKATKLVLNFVVADELVGRRITVTYTACANSNTGGQSTKEITLTGTSTNVEFELSSSLSMNSATFGNYNGVDVECAVNGNPFSDTTELNSDGSATNTYGDNYIKLEISGFDGVIELVGLYDKV